MPIPARSVEAPADLGSLLDSAIDFAAIRRELGVRVEFPPEVVAEAAAAAAAPLPLLPDETDLPMVTIDPPGSLDLDQAVHLSSAGSGYRVRYAIADVGGFVVPGGALDAEARRRGTTLYSPDGTVPLHPRVLSEGAASLLPDVVRPAVLWTIDLDAEGEPVAVDVRRALVRSVAKLSYQGVQADLATPPTVHPSIRLLPEVGRLRLAAARRRRAISLDLPDAEVVRAPDGHWTLALRAELPVERWNAEISLLTGMCAAQLMLAGGIGVLRTLPAPTAAQVAALRRATAALGIDWPDGEPVDEVIARMDGSRPRDAAFLEDAVRLLRGAGYTVFDEAADGRPPERTEHGGVGAPYAHVTAPLRRLVDRFGTQVCLALSAGTPVPPKVRAALPELPGLMSAADRTASALRKADQGAVSTFLLAGREGEMFAATVLQLDPERDRATVVLHDPPVRARCPVAGLAEGLVVRVRLVSADPASHTFRVEPVL